MNNFVVRTISGAVLCALIIGSILLHPVAYALVLLFVVAVGTFELGRLSGVTDTAFSTSVIAFSSFVFILSTAAVLHFVPVVNLVLLLPFALLPFLFGLFSKEYKFSSIAPFVFGSLSYLVLPSVLMLSFYDDCLFGKLAGPALIILTYSLIWINDTFAYISGSIVGKHKLFERISPGKTIEGSLGGLFFTGLSFLVFNHYMAWFSPVVALGLIIIVVLFGTLGDLCESMLKRQAGVKDSGNIIPGHGGILDRFDSIMFSVPFVFAYLILCLK